MSKKGRLILTTLLFTAVLLSAIFVQTSTAIIAQNYTSWFFTSDTDVVSVVAADVDGDGAEEIVTGGYHNDGTRWVAQLIVWNGSTLAVEKIQGWYWTSNTQITSVVAGDVDGDGGVEIVTGGAFFDNTRWVAQLVVWNGSTLAVESVQAWYWTSNTYIDSIAVGNVDADAGAEIVTGGAFFDNTRWVAQLVVWNGSTLAVENVQAWYQVSNTDIASVVVGDVDGDTGIEIVTGGSYFDNTRYNAQLAVWNGSTLTVENAKTWYNLISNATISSVAYGDFDNNGIVDIATGGKFFDGVRWNAQLTIQPGNTLLGNTGTNWYQTSDTYIESIAVGNIGGTTRIITGGAFSDLSRTNAQLAVWS